MKNFLYLYGLILCSTQIYAGRIDLISPHSSTRGNLRVRAFVRPHSILPSMDRFEGGQGRNSTNQLRFLGNKGQVILANDALPTHTQRAFGSESTQMQNIILLPRKAQGWSLTYSPL